jgi:nitrite reductase (NADH) large subunit
VLATGSDPIVVDVAGAELAGVETFRSLADVDAFGRFVATGRPAVVVGGGLLGIEAAYALAKRGVGVTLVHLMDRLMERQLDASGAALLAEAVGNLGIRVLLGAQTRAVHGNRSVEAVELADGRRIDCGLVVMAVGIRPRKRWAERGGLKVARGVIVDDRMQTSAPGIYAVGECAEHRGICYGLVEPCHEQARVAAAAIAGDRLSYSGSMLATNLKVSGVPVFSAGDFEGADADSIVMRDASGPSYRKLVTRNGRLAGAVLVGDTSDAVWYADLIRSGRSVAAIRASLAFGQAFAEAA